MNEKSNPLQKHRPKGGARLPQSVMWLVNIKPNDTEFAECDHLDKLTETHAVPLGRAFRFFR